MSSQRRAGAHVLVRSEHPQGAYAARLLRGRGRDFVRALGLRAELSVLVTTDDEVQALNRTWRRKDRPTDVLSFEQDRAAGLLGDVVVSLDTARRQARELGHPLSEELSRLLAHGLLHLLGHDHATPRQARRMAQEEERLLGRTGLVADAVGSAANPRRGRGPSGQRKHQAPARRARARKESS